MIDRAVDAEGAHRARTIIGDILTNRLADLFFVGRGVAQIVGAVLALYLLYGTEKAQRYFD